MLEHYEMAELEKKWEEYDKNRKKFRINKNNTSLPIKIDSTIFVLVGAIALSVIAIVWILKSDSNSDVKRPTPIASIKTTAIEQNLTHASNKSAQDEPKYDRSDYNITSSSETNKASNSQLPTLSMNEIGINSSVDAGGFTIRNNYNRAENFQGAQNSQDSNFAQNSDSVKSALFNSIPKDDIIDFGNAPLPPKAFGNGVNQVAQAPKIVIQRSGDSERPQSIEDRYYDSKDINLAIKIANDKFNLGDYSGARDWALEVNGLDEKNMEGWLIFAKSSYKLGRKDEAITALNAFLKIAPGNSEAVKLLDEFKGGK